VNNKKYIKEHLNNIILVNIISGGEKIVGTKIQQIYSPKVVGAQDENKNKAL